MKLKTRIWLYLSILMGVVLCIDLSVSYRQMNRELRMETEQDARTIYGYMMATRRVYQQQFLDSGIPLNRKTVGFLPAHSFSRISKDFHNWNQSGINFNNVSDIPRNPGNQADRFELESMAWFRTNPEAEEHTQDIVDDLGVGYLLYTAPIWIEPFCLKCHGDAGEAPETIQETYSTAYDYKVGDLRGVVSIKIPTAKFDQRFRKVWIAQLVKSLIGYLVLFAVLGMLLDRLVMRRLARLQVGAELVATGDYGARVESGGEDEIHGLAETFNRMAEEVQNREKALGKLSLVVEQSPENVIITDLEGRIEYVNGAFVTNTGYSREEVIGRNSRLLKSGRTSESTYRRLWKTLLQGNVWRGEFINRRKDGSEFVELAAIAPLRGVDGKISHYVAVKQDITDKNRAAAEINRLAYYDSLTGLPNRSLLMDRLGMMLAASRRNARMHALILFNIDRFKNLNNARGHQVGDALLIAVGGRLSALLREGDTLARLAADEYAMLLPDLGSNGEMASRRALATAERIHGDLLLPYRFEGEETRLTASLGICLCPQGDDDSPQEILRRADTALRRAKETGGGQTAFFDTDMGETAEQRFQIERELRSGIPEGQLRLFLQPQVDAAGNLAGAEALVRWQHPDRGLLPPGVFIPIAEESGLIVELGAWVLKEACALMARERMDGRTLRLSVNLSPRHFRQANFVPWMTSLLAASGADPSHLTLEVTEGLVIHSISEVVGKMSELAEMGLHFSVDDFGTGYSSLAYLKRLPVQELKIDKTFVQDAPTDLNDAALVETILSVADHMHLRVVAEGVETEEQAEFLNARASVIHQGYLYGKPEAAEVWLERWRG